MQMPENVFRSGRMDKLLHGPRSMLTVSLKVMLLDRWISTCPGPERITIPILTMHDGLFNLFHSVYV